MGNYLDEKIKKIENDIKGENKGENLLLLSRIYFERRELDQSLSKSRSALAFFTQKGDKKGIFCCNTQIVYISLLKRDYNESWQLIKENEEILKSIPLRSIPPDYLSLFYLMRGRLFLARQEYDLSQKNMEEVLRIAGENKDVEREILALSNLSRLYCRKKEKEYEKAMSLCSQGMEKASALGDPYLQCVMLQTCGDVKEEQKQFDDALVLYLSGATICRHIDNPGMEGELLLDVSGVYSERNQWDECWKYARSALEVFSDSSNEYYRLQSCVYLMQILYMIENKEKIVEMETILKKNGEEIKDPLYKAIIYTRLGMLLQQLKKEYNDALSAFESAEKFFAQTDDKKEKSRFFMQKGFLFTYMKRYEDALAQYDKALAIRKTLPETDGKDDPGYFHFSSPGEIYRRRGGVYFIMSKLKESIENYNQALNEDSSPERTYDRVLDRQALLYPLITSYDIGAVKEQIDLSFREIPQLKRPEQRAVCYNNVLTALIFASRPEGLQEYALADRGEVSPIKLVLDDIYKNPETVQRIREGYKEWISLAEEKKDSFSLGMAYLFQGVFFTYGKNMEEDALESYQQALKVFEKAGMPRWQCLAYYFMGELYAQQGKDEEAFQSRQKALEIYEKAQIPDGQIYSLLYVGAYYRKKQDYAKALEAYDRALPIAKKMGVSNYIIMTRLSKAYTLLLWKKYKESLEIFVDLKKEIEESNDKGYEALCLAYMGKCHKELGNTQQAIGCYLQAFEMFRLRSNILQTRDVALEAGEILEKEGREEEALELYLKSLEEMKKIIENTPAGEQAELSRFAPNRDLFERAILLSIRFNRYESALELMEMSHSLELVNGVNLEEVRGKDEDMDKLLDKMEEIRKRITLLQKDIDSSSDSERKDSLSLILADTRQDFFITLNEIKSKNPDFERLISIRGSDLAVIQKIIPDDTLLLEYYPSESALYIFVITRESFTIKKVDVNREQMLSHVRAFLDSINGFSAKNNQKSDEEDFRHRKKLLYSYLIEPVWEDMEKKDRLLITPSGFLWYLPLEILGKDDKSYLIQQKEISYISSADVLKMVQERNIPPRSQWRLLAVGNPQGVDLPGSDQEVNSIAGIFPLKMILTGKSATKEEFVKNVESAFIIHIASHSSLNRKEINRSYIQFAGDKLFLGEVYGLPIKNSPLVILSSCESALGEENPGGEFASLASAFTLAGASSVIASLWRVDDESTSLLFQEFYKNLLKGDSPSQSLRKAKISLIENPSTSHPFYWGAFILMGGGR